MADLIHLLVLLGVMALPFVAMPLLWRRMKRVRAQAYESSEGTTRQPGWEEAVQNADGLNLVRSHAPNEDLIALGDKARHGRWPLNND